MELEGGKSKPLSKKTKFDFFSSGAYGCTTHPKISCEGDVDANSKSKTLSKLSLIDAYSKNEYEIGEFFNSLQGNSQYQKYLSHLLYVKKHCDIMKKKISINQNKYSCKIIEKSKNSHHQKFMLMYMDYVESTELSKVLKRTKSKKGIIKLLLKYYYFSMTMIEFLCSHHIVHHDLHLSNFLVEKESKKLYMIDFGHALQINKLVPSNGEEINHDYAYKLLHDFDATWPYWPIEYHVLAYYYYENEELTTKTIREIVDDYYDNVKLFRYIYSDQKLKTYKSKVVDFIKEKYMQSKKSLKEKIVEIIKESWNTWDLYQTNYLMMLSLIHYDIDFSEELKDLCKMGLHYDAKMRYDASFYSKRLMELLLDFNQEGSKYKVMMSDSNDDIELNTDNQITKKFLDQINASKKRKT
jgi:hypothetical protein